MSPDGAFLASVQTPEGRSDPVMVVIHETATGRLFRQIPLRTLSATLRTTAYRTTPSLAFSGDGTRLALAITTGHSSTAGTRTDPGTHESHAFVWSLADGRELFHDVTSYPYVSGPYARAALSRDGARLALSHATFDLSKLDRSTRYSGDLSVVDVADGRERIHITSAEIFTAPRR